MTAVSTVAIAGTGVAGLAAAIQLARGGVAVDVFEAKSEPSHPGVGHLAPGQRPPRLRRARRVGRHPAAGYPFEGLNLRAPGPGAPIVAELPDVKTGGPDYPAAMGMPRADLARILLDHAQQAGATVRFGAKVTGLEHRRRRRARSSSDGESAGRYDLLIGADGLNSHVRRADRHRDQARADRHGHLAHLRVASGLRRAQRAVLRRPDVHRGLHARPARTACTRSSSRRRRTVSASATRRPRASCSTSRAPTTDRGTTSAPTSTRAPTPTTPGSRSTSSTGAWNRGRVVIIGDAAHSCPPTIAQGAAQGLEDAVVLTELLLARDAVDQALWDDFHARRRATRPAVVEASVQLGQWQIDGDRDADVPGLIFGIAQSDGGAGMSAHASHRRRARAPPPSGLHAEVERRAPEEVAAAADLERRRNGIESLKVSGRHGRVPHPEAHRRARAPGMPWTSRASTASGSASRRTTSTRGRARAWPVWVAGETNRLIAEHVGQAPDRLTGLGVVPLQHPARIVEYLDDAVLGRGLAGVEISSFAGDVELSDERLEPFWARAAELGCVVFLHPFGCSLDERLDRFYLANTVGSADGERRRAVAPDLLGRARPSPGPQDRRGARRRLPAVRDRPLRPRVARAPRRATLRARALDLPAQALVRHGRARPDGAAAPRRGRRRVTARAAGQRLPVRHGLGRSASASSAARVCRRDRRADRSAPTRCPSWKTGCAREDRTLERARRHRRGDSSSTTGSSPSPTV